MGEEFFVTGRNLKGCSTKTCMSCLSYHYNVILFDYCRINMEPIITHDYPLSQFEKVCILNLDYKLISFLFYRLFKC